MTKEGGGRKLTAREREERGDRAGGDDNGRGARTK